MPVSTANFSVGLLTNLSGAAEVDQAIFIFERNTPPRLRTDTVEIRKKIAEPQLKEGFRYFAVLYRGSLLIGFAMFGYYSRGKLVIIDHMVIDKNERGESAFAIFTDLLIEEMKFLSVDYIAIEVELDAAVKSRATGIRMMRLLGWVNFGKAEVAYCLPATDTQTLSARYVGALMLKSMHEAAEDFTKIGKGEIEGIVRTIYFNHYYDWYQEFWEVSQLASYKTYLDNLFKEFKRGVKRGDVAITHFLGSPLESGSRQPRESLLKYFLAFTGVVVVCAAVISVLKVPLIGAPALLVAILGIFAGVVAVARGDAPEVFKATLKLVVRRHQPENGKSVESNGPGRLEG